MLKVALAQLKAHKRRFIAVTLAVMLGVGFLSATLLVRSSTQATLEASIGATYPQGAVVVTSNQNVGKALQPSDVQDVRNAPGVGTAEPQYLVNVTARIDQQEILAGLRSIPQDPKLRTVTTVSGTLPQADSEIIVDKRTADRNNIRKGSVIGIPVQSAAGAPADSAKTVPFTVSGIAETTSHPQYGAFPMLQVNAGGIARLGGDSIPMGMILASPAAGVNPDALATAIQSELRPDLLSRTWEQQTIADVAAFSGGADQLTPVLLLFASLALVVTMLVISNTFSVLVAQRTRELALLRTLGAQGIQVQRSVLVEALIVGFIASILGVLLAIGCVAALIAWAQSNPDFAFASLRLDTWAATVPVAVGIIITVLAALIPARRATRIAPLAALRPVEETTLKTHAGRTRLTVGVIATLVGFALLALGWFTGMLVIAFFGGLISFVGILMAAQLFMPGAIAAVGSLFNRTGTPAKLAVLNSVRNPGRTTATATALLIGATLVSMMVVGAQTAKTTMDTALKGTYPVDLSVSIPLLKDGDNSASAQGSRNIEQAEKQVADLQSMDGIQASALLKTVGRATQDAETTSSESQQGPQGLPLYVLPENAANVLNDSSIDLSQNVIWSVKEADKNPATITGTSATPGKIEVRPTNSNFFPYLMGAESAAVLGLSPNATQNTADADYLTYAWVKVDSGLSPNEILDLREKVANALGVPSSAVGGGAIERAMFMQIIDVLLLIVLALLAVAVVISIIGVANTLSLSVLERTQENALLRALGLTKGQLRAMLSMEALLISVVSVVLGMILGGIYGAVGAGTALVLFAPPVVTVPWAQFGLILVIAVLAGLLASLMPARRAARLSPVEGLATA